ncbi:LOW QUALITY PROTEIN: U1 small nuclear ribonucleoprotein C-like [Molossus nigricans]
MPKLYCDHSNMYLTHDSPSVRKTHYSGRKHKENMKDYYQKWMEEQAQGLIDKTTTAFQQGKMLPTLFSAPPPAGAIPPLPSLLSPSHPDMVPGEPTPGMRPPMGGHMPMMPGPPMMRPPAHPMMVPTPPGMTQPDR